MGEESVHRSELAIAQCIEESYHHVEQLVGCSRQVMIVGEENLCPCCHLWQAHLLVKDGQRAGTNWRQCYYLLTDDLRAKTLLVDG